MLHLLEEEHVLLLRTTLDRVEAARAGATAVVPLALCIVALLNPSLAPARVFLPLAVAAKDIDLVEALLEVGDDRAGADRLILLVLLVVCRITVSRLRERRAQG